MIAGILHQGSGLGNQLHRYVAIRVLAEDKGFEWGFAYTNDGSGKVHGFKGKDFMPLNLGREVSMDDHSFFSEKKVLENGVDIRGYDPEINFVGDNTLIDGEFQDERYWSHRIDNVREWLKVEELPMDEDLCVIGFRGGEFQAFPDLFLTKEYWDSAIGLMRLERPNIRFEVHTDDPETAKQFFPDFPVIHDVALNWRSVRYAKWLILANSSFYIFPALLGPAHKIIAPRYWARRNTGVWALPQNYYSDKRIQYI